MGVREKVQHLVSRSAHEEDKKEESNSDDKESDIELNASDEDVRIANDFLENFVFFTFNSLETIGVINGGHY